MGKQNRLVTVLLVGAAGSGKTWVMKKIIEHYRLSRLGKIGMILYHRDDAMSIFVLGKYDGTTFEGSDRLSMAVMRDVPEFQRHVTCPPVNFVVCEGDRFTNKTFIETMKPYVIKITDDGSVGRKKRGSNQTERQLKSIATRVANTKADMLVEKSTTALRVIKDIIDGRKKV